MKYFYDCEFLEDGRTIDLISIGIVDESGREYYAVAEDVQTDQDLHDRICRHSWLMDNVVPHLPLTQPATGPLETVAAAAATVVGRRHFAIDLDHVAVLPRRVIAKQVRAFLHSSDAPELWAYYGAYDHVALCQLWGAAVDRPEGIPMWTNDLQQEHHRLGQPDLPPTSTSEHNALVDARWNSLVYRVLQQVETEHLHAFASGYGS